MQRKTRGTLIVLGTVVIGIGLSILSFKLGVGVIGTAVGFLVLVIVTVLSDFLAKPWQELIDSLFQIGRRRPVRVFAFAATGAGKSSLQGRLLGPFTPVTSKKTSRFFIRKNTVPIDIVNDIGVRVAISDYAGQEMNQIFLDEHREFFGAKGEELVDVLYFLVDIISAEEDANGNPLPDEEIIRLYAKDGDSKVSQRVDEHLRWLNPGVLDTVLKKCGAEKGSLTFVRVIVTKIDLARRLAELGYISIPGGQSVEDCLLDQYRQAIAEVAASLCEERYRKQDFKYYCANLKTGEGILDDWKQILQRLYNARLREERKSDH
jgi:hypothetical protein